ncbi:MAG: hypothetical protein K6B71_00375 [Alphaproteobacteria bacterium]|nr:hypothetical protein [Alphaproteobacteria bacterium]
MKTLLKKLTTFTLAMGAVALLTGCADDTAPRHAKHHRHHTNQDQEMVMVEMTETMTAEMAESGIMKAKMYTKNGRGEKSEMGCIKFVAAENGIKMMVDLTDLRPGKDYTVKIYKCAACSSKNCCDTKCMNINLPILSIDTPGRLTKTFDVPNINWNDLNNAKIVLVRDGGYKAAWGRLYPTMGF